MPDTYDLATDIGQVRLLINDTNVGGAHVYTDAEITAFLTLEGGVFLAAALALDTIANDMVQVMRVIKLLDLQTDGAKTAEALRAQAAVLRQRADETGDDAGFEIVEWAVDDFTARDIAYNEWVRAEG